MTTYLVDFENVHNSLFTSENLVLKSRDKVILFRHENDHSIVDGEKIIDLVDKGVSVKIVHTQGTTKNALDFQLAYYAGRLSLKNEKVVIISNDKGYDVLNEFSKQFGAECLRIATADNEHKEQK